MNRTLTLVLLALLGCGPQVARLDPDVESPYLVQPPPPLPDSLGTPPHVLAIAPSPTGDLWVGTYGRGIFVLRYNGRGWERITSGDSTSISWDFVNSFAFSADGREVWYGTVGNGYGVSRDGGRTWRNWQFRQLGPEFQYVVPDGIRVRGREVYVATADGLRWSDDRGESWHCVGGADGVRGGTPERADACASRTSSLPSEYLYALDLDPDGRLWVGHARGLSHSTDRGRTWTTATGPGLATRVRDVLADSTGVWAITETALFRDSTGRAEFTEVRTPRGLPGAPRALAAGVPYSRPLPGYRAPRASRWPVVVTSQGALRYDGGWRTLFVAAGERFRPASDLWTAAPWGVLPLAGAAWGLQRVLAGEAPLLELVAGDVARPQPPLHVWFRRPIADTGANPYIDGTYRYGSTMGGNFQQHQGVEFNNAAGTPVLAAGDGVVAFAGPAEQGALTVVIRHDRQWEGRHVFTTYFHNTALEVRHGQRVRAGDVIARVGNTGRATNDHLHFEVHVTPTADSLAVVNPAERFPPYTVNPQLWLEPVPGTGIVAGRVFDAAGQPVPGARVYGLVVPYPTETPFSFAETYRERAHPDPAYGEHFAVGDVSPGEYVLSVVIGDRRVWRRARVEAGAVTWVEFRP